MTNNDYNYKIITSEYASLIEELKVKLTKQHRKHHTRLVGQAVRLEGCLAVDNREQLRL